MRRFPMERPGQVRQRHPLLPPPGRDGSDDGGKIYKVRLFEPWRWLRNVPDLRTIRMFVPHFLTRRKDCRDDSLLGTIVAEFAAEGIRFGPVTEYVPELLVGEGQLTRRGPTAGQRKDIRFGWQMAKEMGRLDIGQSVAVKDQAVLAVEAVEGTDECIRRAGALCALGDSPWSRWPSRSRTCVLTCPPSAWERSKPCRRRRQGVGDRGRPHHPPRRARGDRVCRPPSPGDRGRDAGGGGKGSVSPSRLSPLHFTGLFTTVAFPSLTLKAERLLARHSPW